METKKCVVCGREFIPHRGSQICCSPPCSCKRALQVEAERAAARRKPREIRKCEYCGEEYEAKNPQQKFCSTACSKEYWRRNYASTYRDKSGLTLQVKICPTCGKTFETFRTDKKYCSETCHGKTISKKIEIERQQAPQQATKEVKPKKKMADWEREARDCNLDYGTYRGLIAAGKTFDELKALYAEHVPPTHARASRGSHLSTDYGYGTKIS